MDVPSLRRTHRKGRSRLVALSALAVPFLLTGAATAAKAQERPLPYAITVDGSDAFWSSSPVFNTAMVTTGGLRLTERGYSPDPSNPLMRMFSLQTYPSAVQADCDAYVGAFLPAAAAFDGMHLGLGADLVLSGEQKGIYSAFYFSIARADGAIKFSHRQPDKSYHGEVSIPGAAMPLGRWNHITAQLIPLSTTGLDWKLRLIINNGTPREVIHRCPRLVTDAKASHRLLWRTDQVANAYIRDLFVRPL